MVIKNKERRSANITLIILFIGLLAIFLPWLLNADMMDWGFAVAFFGVIISLSCFFIFLMFNSRAKVIKRMFLNENILVHWNYTKEFWDRLNKEDMKESGVGKIFGFFIGGLFVLIGFIFLIVDSEENSLFFLIMLGVGIFFVIIGFAATFAERRRIRTAVPEAIISKDGLYYRNILYAWNAPLVSFLESISIDADNPTAILFTMRILTGTRFRPIQYHQNFVSVPIPPGQEDSARSVIRYFNTRPS
ncbi:MAG: hypothetical protein WC677_01740 [Clostridia bacterium]|jgi:hypothetical protein